jgi:hypothetical protein
MSPPPSNEDEFLVWVRIPQMTVELMQGGSPQLDGTWLGGHILLTGLIACGQEENFSPVTQVRMRELILRPNYTPVHEDGEHQAQEPDLTLSPARPQNALGRVRLGVFPVLGIPDSGRYRIHGTSEPQSIGTMASGGCIRVENESVEQIAALLLDSIPIRSITSETGEEIDPRTPFGELLQNRQQYTILFEKPYRIRVTCQLWNEHMNFTERELGMAIYPDLYGRLQGKPTPSGCPEDPKNEGNSYTYDHFVRDLKKNGLGPALGVGEISILRLWEEVKRKITAFSLTVVETDAKGVGHILKKEGWISIPVDVLVKGGSWDKIEEERNMRKMTAPDSVPRGGPKKMDSLPKKQQDSLPPKRQPMPEPTPSELFWR